MKAVTQKLKILTFYYHCYFIQQFMFLNLKSKRVETALQNHLKTHNHPKTQREERPERTSKEHVEIRPKKPAPNAMIKKQTASTALTTIQPGSSCSNVAHHYIIHRIESLEKDGADSFSKSIEKMDSQRSQKIANAYRKIKKYDGSDIRVQTQESAQERPKKSQNRTHYPLNKKQIVTNFANNYIAITEADEYENKRTEYSEAKEVIDNCSKMIELFLQVFRRQSKIRSTSVVKFRSLSSKEIDLNDSLQRSKRSNKNMKSRGKGLQATQHSNNHDQENQSENFQDLVEKVKQNLVKSEQKFDELVKGEYPSQINVLMKQLYAELCWFVKEVHNKSMSEFQEKCEQYEKGLEIVIMEQTHMEKHCKNLEEALTIERNRNSILAQSLEELHNRSLYSCAFLNQLSFKFDLDTFIHEKICEFAGNIGTMVNSNYESSNSLALKEEFLESDFEFLKLKQKI